MSSYLDQSDVALWFASAPYSDSAWISGELLQLEPARELIAFKFDQIPFVMSFSSLDQEFGGDVEFAQNMAAVWSGGFLPDPQHRLVKFFRTTADEDSVFDPDAWKLPNPRQIFQFGELLVQVVLAHSAALPLISQYFYKPASARLAAFYARTFEHSLACAGGKFQPILDVDVEAGGFYGYQKTGAESGST